MLVLRRLGIAAAVVASLVVAGLLARAWWDSRVPGTYNTMRFGKPDSGGAASSRGPVVSVAALTGTTPGPPDERFTLTAEHARVRLASGKTVNALTFGGRVPGLELRVHTGDLVEVVLLNKDIKEGVTIHWHGVDVPNADDGVAGVTQNAVPVGGRYVYRFRVEQTGTFWYHTHQNSESDVGCGLYGAFVIEPREPVPQGSLDLALIAHTLGGARVLNASDATLERTVRPGTRVRLRLVNSNDTAETFALGGTAFDVRAIDGTDVNRPTSMVRRLLAVAAGGRYDVEFTMPRRPVRLDLLASDAAVVLSPDGRTTPSLDDGDWPRFDPLGYGSPAPTQFGAMSHFDRSFVLKIQKKLGFQNGRPGFHWAINGDFAPRVPMFVVSRGDLVKMSIVNDSNAVHPMHLHGHHMLVLSRNGVVNRGSPWWSDTLEVDSGDRYEVAFRADNPGLWMDHCHILRHATAGLTMHIMYAGVWTPFQIGGRAHNSPE